MSTIRAPAVAGMFYPDDPEQLRAMVSRFLRDAEDEGPVPKAIIAPHAGYIYSGPIAASAYVRVARGKDTIRQVILLGPAHRVALRGLAASRADAFATPLGMVPVDTATVARLVEAFPQVRYLDEAHTLEHSLEVHLPFLQLALDDFTIVPLVVGDAGADEVNEVLEAVWNGPETLIVISSDLSHYHDYDTARRLDQQTSQAIVTLHPERIGHEDACGRNPVTGLLKAARTHGLQARLVDLRNSGDTAGPRDQVVGYGAYVFEEHERAA